MEHEDECAISYTWLDKSFDMPSPPTWDDVNYELACTMHNIGAVYSQIGAAEHRVDLEVNKALKT